MPKTATKGVSPIIRTIVTIILLVLTLFAPLVGLLGIVVMWVWTFWPKWLKVLITIPFAIFYTLLLASTVGVLSYLFLVRSFQVNGNAMAPNFNNGMYLMTKVVRPNNIVVEKGNVIVFKSPQKPEVEYIKRVVGMPGETVMVKSGEVYINGQKLDEAKYLSPGVITNAGLFLAEGQTLTIPTGQYFTLGDNRPHSLDSREWGFVPQENIISKALFCYWNCSKNKI